MTSFSQHPVVQGRRRVRAHDRLNVACAGHSRYAVNPAAGRSRCPSRAWTTPQPARARRLRFISFTRVYVYEYCPNHNPEIDGLVLTAPRPETFVAARRSERGSPSRSRVRRVVPRDHARRRCPPVSWEVDPSPRTPAATRCTSRCGSTTTSSTQPRFVRAPSLRHDGRADSREGEHRELHPPLEPAATPCGPSSTTTATA